MVMAREPARFAGWANRTTQKVVSPATKSTVFRGPAGVENAAARRDYRGAVIRSIESSAAIAQPTRNKTDMANLF
jgi:hypothetical protein